MAPSSCSPAPREAIALEDGCAQQEPMGLMVWDKPALTELVDDPLSITEEEPLYAMVYGLACQKRRESG